MYLRQGQDLECVSSVLLTTCIARELTYMVVGIFHLWEPECDHDALQFLGRRGDISSDKWYSLLNRSVYICDRVGMSTFYYRTVCNILLLLLHMWAGSWTWEPAELLAP
jgi:hypothetical protein